MTTVSAKIPEKLKEKTKLYNIKISRVVRRAIEDEVRKIEDETLSKDLVQIGKMLKNTLSSKEIVKAVRSSRNER